MRLRGFQMEDADAHAAIVGDPAVMRHIGGRPNTREEAWRKLLSVPGLWALLGYGYWAVERRSDGALIGQLGFADFRRDLDPSIEGIPEMGWLFATDAHGRGFAYEGTEAALRWADDALPGREFAAIIHPDNRPSIKLAERLGFARASQTSYHGDPTVIFRRSPASGEARS